VRWVAYCLGLAFIGIGIHGIFADPRNTGPGGWIRWFVGGVVIHDALFAPALLVLAALVVRVPLPYRRVLQAALIVGGSLTLVGLPVVLGYGRRADNPSQLPLDYGRNLILLWIVIGTASLVATLVTFMKNRH
jgi:hypothetical protein